MSKSNILITGGAGFIGSHLVERLLAKGDYITCLDNLDPYYSQQIKERNISPFLNQGNFRFVRGDIRDKRLLRDLLVGVDYIFHDAAQAGVRKSVECPSMPHDVNATGTLRILEAAINSDIKRMINASSSSVYGRIGYLPFNEDHPNLPISPYGVSKLMAEHYCRVFKEIFGLNTISLRYFTVYGPRMRPDLAINIFTAKALRNEPIEIFGTGEKTRDFTYINDVVEANVLALSSGIGPYNIGSGTRISINELVNNIIELTGSRSKVIHKADIKGDADHTWANIERAKKELGWEPKIEIKTGLKRYIEWYIKSS